MKKLWKIDKDNVGNLSWHVGRLCQMHVVKVRRTIENRINQTYYKHCTNVTLWHIKFNDIMYLN